MVMAVRRADTSEGSGVAGGPKTASVLVSLRNKVGLHARPAGTFANTAKKFRSAIKLTYRDKQVDGKSILGLISLDAWQGAFITIEATGDDAPEAVEALTDLIRKNFGEPE
jgi:phosphotransferase system HPr (HPr) family protein